MGWCSKHCPAPSGGVASAVLCALVTGGLVSATAAAVVVARILDSVIGDLLAATGGLVLVSVVFAAWFVRRQILYPGIHFDRRPGLEALPVAEQVAIATGEVRRKAIGPPRRVVATVVSRTDEPSVGLRP
jgi:hypothetical protein